MRTRPGYLFILSGSENLSVCPLASDERQNLLMGSIGPDLTSSVPLDHRWSVDISDITVTARDGEIVYCDIGWCISPAVAPLTLETQRLQLIFIMLMRLRSRVSAEAGPDVRVVVMYACS